jgi:stage II sporulation protein D
MAPSLITRIILLAISFQLIVHSCFAQSQHFVRVLIIEKTSSMSLKALGNFEIVDARNNMVLSRGGNIKTTVMGYRNGILLAGKSFDTDKILIKTQGTDAIMINGRTFRGDIQLTRVSGYLSVINQIDLEDYIKGILYHEASHYWPMEALKAQAIVCRTYAVYQMQENKSRDFDVTSDIYSQVYGGRTSERERTNGAVEATKGEILTYQNKVFPAYFHATCAGHTEDASMLWNIDLPPLKGVVCDYCKDSPHYNWHLVLDRGELRQRLVNAGYKMGMIKAIEILGKNNSGRITNLKITTTTKDVNISAKDLRSIVGPNEIRSTNFTVNLAGDDAVFEGFGWGHGVGLCQWGAYFMAKQGRNVEEILKYYYPRNDVKTIGF